MRTSDEKSLAIGASKKAIELLRRQGSGFINVKDINAETANHPFGDVFAGRVNSHPCVIGVKTRNMYKANGLLNSEYNVRKNGRDIDAIGKRYNAQLAWVAIQVIPELQTFNAYFGTIDQIQEDKERFSIPIKAHDTPRYQRLGAKDEFDPTIRKEWSNGGYPLSKAKVAKGSHMLLTDGFADIAFLHTRVGIADYGGRCGRHARIAFTHRRGSFHAGIFD